MDTEVNSEIDKTPMTDNPTKISKKMKKGVIASDMNKSDDQISELKDGNLPEVVGNGKVESDKNVHLQMELKLESGLNAIEEIKKIISKFEQNYLKISKLTPEVDMASFMRNFDVAKFQEDKCVQESNPQNTTRNEIIRKSEEDKANFKKFENDSELRTLVKNCKSAIHSLEKKLDGKKKYRSESPTESEEEEESDDSAYDPRNRKSGFSSGHKRGRPKKSSKTGRRLPGRPRKSVVDDHSSNSAIVFKEKRSRGRPRKTIVDDEKSSLSDGEPPVKKSRGRPRKHEVENDHSSSSVKDSKSKEESDSLDSKDKDSSNDKNEDDSGEIPVKNENENSEKKHRGRPKKHFNNEIEFKDKRPRGRPKSNLSSEIHGDDSKTTNDLDSSIAKSRGRPKKSKTTENESFNST